MNRWVSALARGALYEVSLNDCCVVAAFRARLTEVVPQTDADPPDPDYPLAAVFDNGVIVSRFDGMTVKLVEE